MRLASSGEKVFQVDSAAKDFQPCEQIIVHDLTHGHTASQRLTRGSVLLDLVLDEKIRIDGVFYKSASWRIGQWPGGKRKITNCGKGKGHLISLVLRKSPEWWLEWPDNSGVVSGAAMYFLLRILWMTGDPDGSSAKKMAACYWGLFSLLREAGGTKSTVRFGDLKIIYPIGERLALFEDPMTSPAELVRMSGLKTCCFQIGFRLLFGLSVREMIRQLKMKQAYHRVVVLGEHVDATGRALGYRHPANFITAFRCYFGFTPGDARGYFF